MTGILKSTANYLFDTLAEAIDPKVLFRLGDVIDIADANRGVYRVVPGGTGIADGVNYIDLDNGYQLQLLYAHKATVDVTDYQATEINSLIGSSGMTIKANTIEKTSGSVGWNEQVYSQNFFTGGARISCQPAQTDKNFMIGLNTDPLTDANYTSIDYAIYATASGTVEIYESGVSIGSFGSYIVGSLLEIRYDGEDVKYYVDDVLKRTVFAGLGIDFYFDSSFNDLNGKATHIRFEHYFDSTNIDYAATEINTFVASGTMTIQGATLKKTSGSTGWGDAQVYSQNFQQDGSFLKFKTATTDKIYAMGINTDPLTSPHYNTIDYCFYLSDTATLFIFESGTQIGSYGSYDTDTLFEIIYDGYTIKYYKDGSLLRTVANAFNIIFYFDSAFYSLEGEAKNVWFNSYSNPELTSGGSTTFHYHATDRDRTNHTGTQTAATISDFDTEVANNSAVTANTAKVSNATHTGDVTGSTVLTIADDAVTIPKLSATGTPSATTFLSGDDSWKSVTGTPISDGAYSRASWNGDAAQGATRNAISDEIYNISVWRDAETGGAGNQFMGPYVGRSASGTSYATGAGFNCLQNLTSGNYNSCYGGYSGASIQGGSENSFFGLNSGRFTVSGVSNSAFGFQALYKNIASYNTAIGADSMANLSTDGNHNVAVGYQSLYLLNNAAADFNVSVGNYSLYSATNTTGTTACGYAAGYNSSTGNRNTLTGHQAGYNIGVGSDCCYGGYNTGFGNASNFNTAYGTESLFSASGPYNTAIGRKAMYEKNGTQCVAIGANSMSQSGNTTGSVGIGTSTLQNINGGDYNLAAGFEAGNAVTSGDYNIYLGYRSGRNMSIGNYNIIIGADIGSPFVSQSYYLAIGRTSAGSRFLTGEMGTNPYFQVNGNFIIASYGVTKTPPFNYNMVIQATSNTNAQIAYKGSDGVVRYANIPLA